MCDERLLRLQEAILVRKNNNIFISKGFSDDIKLTYFYKGMLSEDDAILDMIDHCTGANE
jgi:hypothetical protein